jgi:hypothetical protein
VTLPSITDFAKLLNTATDDRNDATARELAMTHMLSAYARAELKCHQVSWFEPSGEREAVVAALGTFRAVRDESRSDVNLDRLADAQREESEEKQREVELESDVPWGREHR